jgi:hypothetical protein
MKRRHHEDWCPLHKEFSLIKDEMDKTWFYHIVAHEGPDKTRNWWSKARAKRKGQRKHRKGLRHEQPKRKEAV